MAKPEPRAELSAGKQKRRECNLCFYGASCLQPPREIEMPRFYLHTLRAELRAEDIEGSDFDNVTAAIFEATLAMRELIGDDLMAGRPLTPTAIEIAGEDGRVLKKLRHSEVLERNV
ncbi:MAG: hypothetical protein K2X62_04170 [Beijerinckiaceae bacterium]|nr:hypothetical protein [Beijerinckiaceae bacterium]